MVYLIVAVFMALLLLGAPIGFVMGITALVAIFKMGSWDMLVLIPQQMFSAMDMFTIMAMPFFIMAGEIMNKTGITRRLVKASDVLVGHLRGGLAQVNIVASIFFAGITGAAVSDTAALGSLLIPAMTEKGYSKSFSAAVTAASSIIGPIIPPSIIMVLYGSLMNVSIAGLFAGGLLPGILIGVLQMIIAGIICKRRNYEPPKPRPSFREVAKALKEAAPALLMPLIIVGGIYGGVFTPTEAAAVAVGYALVVGVVWFRNLKLREIPRLFFNCASATGMVFLLMSCGSILAWCLASERIPEAIAQSVLSISTNKYAVLLIINMFLLLVGMFMDITAALLILGPILHPLMVRLGVHPIHFGLLMTINLNIGLMTPPVGACLFVASGITKLSLESISREIWPFIIANVAGLLLITYIPAIPMFLPRLLGFA